MPYLFVRGGIPELLAKPRAKHSIPLSLLVSGLVPFYCGLYEEVSFFPFFFGSVWFLRGMT